MSVIEAMLTGLPVVATAIRGPREQVVPEVTGLLVPARSVAPLAAALRRLAGDPALRAAMGAAGRTRALELYDEAKVLARTVALLETSDRAAMADRTTPTYRRKPFVRRCTVARSSKPAWIPGRWVRFNEPGGWMRWTVERCGHRYRRNGWKD